MNTVKIAALRPRNGTAARRVQINSRLKVQVASAFLLVATILITGCTGGGSPVLETAKPTGVTDQPARGYEQIAAGSEEELVMNAGRRVYFSSGSAELDDVARETLDLQAQFLNTHPKWLVKLQGFADDPGTATTPCPTSGPRR